MKRTVLILRLTLIASLILAFMLASSQAYAETEPNDTPGQANPLTPGVTGDTNASLSSDADIDWFKVTVTQDRWYTFETYSVSPNLRTQLRLYDTDGSTRLARVYSNGTGNTLSRITWQAPANGTYYLLVSSSSGAGPYSIRALQKYDEGAIWDGFHEPNDNWQTAHLINVGRENAFNTTIYPRGPYSTNSGDYDYFRFNGVLGHWYVVETFNVAPSLNTRIELYNVDGTSELDDDYSSGKGNVDARIIWQAPQTGTFYIRVIAESGSQEGAYSLRVLPKYDEGASWDADWEPDSEWVTASPIILNQTQSRSLHQRGNYKTNRPDYDYFWFAAEAGNEYTVSLPSVSSTLRANLYIISLDGSTVLADDDSYATPGTPKSVSHTFYTSGIYYVLVRPYSSSSDDYGDYKLQISTSGISNLFVSKQELGTPLRFVGIQGNDNPAAESIVIANSGSGTLSWTASVDQTWLILSAISGSAGSPTTLEISPNIAGMAPGDYSAQITVSADGAANSPQVIQVSLRVDQPLSPNDETEPNNTVSTASTLSVGRLIPTIARLSSSSDTDWFKVTVTQDRWYTFETYNVSPNLRTQLRLYDTDGSTRLARVYSNGTGNTLSRITWQASANGTYYLLVSSSSGAGPYSIRALQKYDEGATWDGFHEPNDNWQTAHLINVGRENAINTTIYPRGPYSTNNGEYDYFRFNVVLGHWYVIETFNVAPSLNTRIELYNVDGTSELDDDYSSGKGNVDARIIWHAPQTGTFYIRVIAESGSQVGAYSLRVLSKYDEGASWDADWEPDSEWVTASPIILNQTQSRNLYQRGNYKTNRPDYDYFWFAAQAGAEYTVSLPSVSSTLRANLYVISLDGSTVLADDDRYATPGTPKSVSYTFATPGYYYVLVRPYSSSYDDYGDYELRVTSVVPAIHLNLERIALNGVLDTESSQQEQLVISNSGYGLFNWSITSSQSWLKVSASSGAAPPSTSVEVWAELTGMSLGTYTATLTITADDIENSPYVIPINLEVQETYFLYMPTVLKNQ